MHIDFLGPLTQTLNGNSYVGLAVCALTKYVEAAGKIANTKLTFLNIRIPLRFKPTTTGGGCKLVDKSNMSDSGGELLDAIFLLIHH